MGEQDDRWPDHLFLHLLARGEQKPGAFQAEGDVVLLSLQVDGFGEVRLGAWAAVGECERIGVSPSRDAGGTLVFPVTLGQFRKLIEAAGQLGLAPVVERGKSINFRTTIEEYEMLAAAGAKVGLSPTGFAALAALEGAALELGHRRRWRRVKDFEALRQMVVEVQLATNQVSRAGVRLSQAVAKLNADGVAPPWLEDAAKKTVKRVEAQDELVFELGGLLREVLH